MFRRRICEHMAAHRDSFEPFFMGEDERVQSFDDYLNNMRKNGTWGGNLELQAASMALQVNIVVHQLEQPRWEVVNWREPNARFIQLSYHTGDHYASVQPIGGAANVPPVYVHSQRASASSASASASPFAQSAMASAAQNNSEVHDALGALAFVDDDANWQEHLVMRTTECTLEEARHALLDNFQDTDAAINFIMTLKLSSLDVDVPKAVNSRQKLTESGGVLSIPTPEDDLVASHATSVRNLTPPPPPSTSSTSSSSSSSSSTADASTSAQSPRAAPAPPAMSAEEAAIASAQAAMAQGWQTKQNRKKKPKSKEELLAKVQAKAPQQHTSNRERKQKGAEQPDGAAPPPDVPPPDVVAQLAGIVPEQELRPVVDLGALAI